MVKLFFKVILSLVLSYDVARSADGTIHNYSKPHSDTFYWLRDASPTALQQEPIFQLSENPYM
jgi:hypothetical protein